MHVGAAYARVWLARRSQPHSSIISLPAPHGTPRLSAPAFSIAILGNDALLAALPAVPVQLMHAALAAGFDSVVPASLGDELVAGEILRIAQLRGRRPVIQCACPFALAQLCKREANLGDITIAVAPSPVALARALRLEHAGALHVTYIGGCPGAQDPAIDLQVPAEAFLRGLAQKGVVLASQPEVFSDRVPADRRRFLSAPGGAPRSELVERVLRRNVVAVEGRAHPMLTIADAMFDGGVTMIDPAGAYNCVCAGARVDGSMSVAAGRTAIERLEPARSATPIFEAPAWLDLRPSEIVTPQVTDDGVFVERRRQFADAAGISAVPDAQRSETVTPAGASSDAARRMYALGVRTSRRRAPVDSATKQRAATDRHISPTTSALHAPPIEREVDIIERRDGAADRRQAPDVPRRQAEPAIADLYRRD